MEEQDTSAFLEVILIRQSCGKDSENPNPAEAHPFKVPREGGSSPPALEVLWMAREGPFPDLAFRYGCRNQRCGLCTIEINGEPALACKTRVSNGDRLGPLSVLPLIRDFVVDRSGMNAQLSGRAGGSERHRSPGSKSPSKRYVSLSRCIECYACLKGCPLHRVNLEGTAGSSSGQNPTGNPRYTHGSPCTFLKLRRLIEDEEVVEGLKIDVMSRAVELGLETCISCYGCRCQIGINLVGEVIKPLLADAAREGLRGTLPGGAD